MENITQINENPEDILVNEEKKESDVEVIEKLLNIYENGDYFECISRIEMAFFDDPKEYGKSTLIRNIYLNCCLRVAMDFMGIHDYVHAKVMYDKILVFESELIFEADVVLYNIYSQISEIMKNVDTLEASEMYHEKAKMIISKMVYSRAIQSIYSAFIEGNYDEVISNADTIDINDLDEYNKGRYYMMIGSAYYYMKEYNNGITYLKKAIKHYKNKTYNSILIMIYEELSKCYMHMEEYNHAYKYLKLAHKHTKLAHNIEHIML